LEVIIVVSGLRFPSALVSITFAADLIHVLSTVYTIIKCGVKLLTLLLTFCGLTSQKSHWGGLRLNLLNLPLKALMLEAPSACWSGWFHLL